MTTISTIKQVHVQEILATQRIRLLGLCTYLTGDPHSAEDIVQEAMLEAWRSFEKLRNPDAVEAWLNGIVRNVCARWQRSRGRDSAVISSDEPTKTGPDSVLETVADDFDLEVELERQEMAILLDRALALLPETTRQVLVSKYIAESRHAEIADQLGLSENAVTVRLHRGKVALRKLLTTELRADAEAFGLITPPDGWTETRIWCPLCGQRRLVGILTANEFGVRCPACSVEPNACLSRTDWTGFESPLGRIKSFLPAFKRHAAIGFDDFLAAITEGEATCVLCSLPLPLQYHLPDYLPPSMRRFRGMHVICERCNNHASMSLPLLALSSPDGRDFFKAHPRIRTLPEGEIELNGVPAIVLSFESVTDSATFDTIVHRDTYTTLAVHRSDGE